MESAHLREVVNDRPFQKMDGSRRTLLTTLDRPALRPLPPAPYEYVNWRQATLNTDYHVSVEKHLYSVPYTLVRTKVDVRLTAGMIEVLHEGRRAVAHPRQAGRGGFTTDAAHRPKSHQAHLEWTPSRLVRWGAEVGAATGAVVTAILERQPHPEQGYRSCLGLLSLTRRYTSARLEAACQRAHITGATSYRSVRSIFATGLDQVPADMDAISPVLVLPAMHEHVRRAAYYRDAVTTTIAPTAITATAITTSEAPC